MTAPIPTDRAELTETQALLLKLAQKHHASQAWLVRHGTYAPHAGDFSACEHPDCAAARRLTGEPR